ncbi:Biotin transporter [Lactococcus lactis subsp. lactis]|nr:Biotin transporter [Lactococcus lactis subsp. lactis]
MQNTKLYSLTLIALGAAIIAVLSPLSIPIGIVPVTLQTLAVGLVATVLKARETFFAILLYLLLGFIGIPVFTGGTSRNCGSFWSNRWFSNCLFNNGNSYFFWPSSN